MKKYILTTLLTVLFLANILADENKSRQAYNKAMEYYRRYYEKYIDTLFNEKDKVKLIESTVDNFRSIIIDYPLSDWAPISQNQIAWIYFQNSQYSNAINEFNLSELKYPDSIFADDSRYQIGFIKFLQREYNSAIYNFNLVILNYSNKNGQKMNDKVPYAYYMIAECKGKQRDVDAAIDWYKKLIDKFPDHEKSKEATIKIQELK